jgi:hypothetical protein
MTVLATTALTASNEVVLDKQTMNELDALSAEIATMSDADFADALNLDLDETQTTYFLGGIVDKAKGVLKDTKEALANGFSWAMCKTVAKLNPLTSFLCKIPSLSAQNASAKSFLDALSESFGMK